MGDSWQSLIDSLSALERAVVRVTAVNVNTSTVRDGAKALIQDYFRRTRPDLSALGVDEEDLESMDGQMQRLLQLANGRNPKRYYTRVLRDLRDGAQHLELTREYRLGEQRRAEAPPTPTIASGVEGKILDTLKDLLPTAALSYEQALRDLAGSTERISFRGTANELREALRETLDRLAPDEDVMGASGFKLEKDRTAAGALVLRVVAVVAGWAQNAKTEARYWAGRQRVSVSCALCRKQLAEGVSLASSREILARHLAHAHPEFTPRRGKQLRSTQA